MRNKQLRILLAVTLTLNIILAVIKLGAGYLYNSPSLVGDGFNSFFDIFISVMLLIVMKTASRAPDENHHYGHQKYEGLIFFGLGLFILFTTVVLGINTVKDFIAYFQGAEYVLPGTPALIVAIVSVFIKVFMFIINYRAYLKLKRPALKGDAINHLSDIFATAVSIISIVLAKFNFYIFEYIGTLIICVIIINSSINIIKEAAYYLTDASPSKKTVESIRECILNVEGVICVDDLKVRRHMNNYYVDVEVGINKNLTLKEAHDISEKVHSQVEANFNVLHCHVHINPH